jgi:nucleotide-binding universal stress UspA family protein
MPRKFPNAPTLALVGIEERDAADHAVVAAFRHAPALKLEVELVHASSVPLDYFAHVDPLGVQKARSASATHWNGVLQAAGIVGSDLEHTLEILPGSPAHALVERALTRGAGVVFLGRHERRGPFDFGDVVRDVITSAPCPVWVQSGAPREVRRVLCAIDLGRSALPVLQLARDVASAFGAELHVLHAFVRPELGYVLGYPVQFPANIVDHARERARMDFDKLLAAFEWRGVSHEPHFYEGEPRRELLTLQKQYDLVVIGTHGRGALARTLVGSVASDLLRRAETPVLVLRNAE